MSIPTALHVTLLLTVLLVSSSVPASAQTAGTVSGRIVEESSGSPVIGCAVILEGTRLGARTDADGRFVIRRVPSGTYTVKVTSIAHEHQTQSGIVVEPGGTARVNAMLKDRAVAGRTVTVTGRASRSSDNAELTDRRQMAAVADAVSSEQISRVQSGDAADAMRKVTGVSVVGDKFVVIRGLQERYNTTQLNNVALPSPEPEKRVVPFDLFPTAMISRLTTLKTFTPDNPGDFAGGLVKIETKSLPESFMLNASLGTGYTIGEGNARALTYVGGSTDLLGIDDGTRALPASIPVGRQPGPQEQASLLSKFTNSIFSPRSTTLPVNQSGSLSIGSRIDAGVPVGLLVSGSYSSSANFRFEEQRYPLLQLTEAGRRDLRYEYGVQRTESTVLWGGLASVSTEFTPDHRLSLKGIYNHSSEDETRQVEGSYNQSTVGDIRYSRLRFLERGIGSLQLDGEHSIAELGESSISWRVARSFATRSEPDNRSVTYFRGGSDTAFTFANNFGSNNSRFFSELEDTEWNAGADWTMPVEIDESNSLVIKAGATHRDRNRSFSARRFLFGTGSSDFVALAQAPEQLFTAHNVESGLITFNDETSPTDAYSAVETVTAGYAMAEIPLLSRIRLIAGARLEQWDLTLVPVNPLNGQRAEHNAANRSVLDVLPALSIVYAVSPSMNVRGSATRTVARPEFRELAPFRFDDYRNSTYGNPGLERTSVLNFDARWEWFPRGGEVVAASLFFKEFTDPIEQFYLIGSGISVEPVNAHRATTAGAEFEFRRSLSFVSEALDGISIGANLTLVTSEVTFEPDRPVRVFDGVSAADYSSAILTSRSRPLQGQSPYVVNAQVSYDASAIGMSATLAYNAFGERLAVVGTEGIPDTYEQPRHTVDLSISQELPAGLRLRINAKNILDSESRMTQTFSDGEQILSERYRGGRSFSIGLGFSFDQLQLQNADDQLSH